MKPRNKIRITDMDEISLLGCDSVDGICHKDVPQYFFSDLGSNSVWYLDSINMFESHVETWNNVMAEVWRLGI